MYERPSTAESSFTKVMTLIRPLSPTLQYVAKRVKERLIKTHHVASTSRLLTSIPSAAKCFSPSKKVALGSEEDETKSIFIIQGTIEDVE